MFRKQGGKSSLFLDTYNNGHSSYNRTNAKNYVFDYTTNPNPAYTDFSSLGGDCTNFASQVLRAGGVSFTATSSNPTTAHWYYYNDSWGTGRTGTWTGAHSFRQHFGDVNGSGTKRSYQMRKYSVSEINAATTTWNNLWDNIGAGDVVQYTDGTTFHSQLVHRKSIGEEGPGIKKISVGQHSVSASSHGWRNLRTYIKNDTTATWVTVIRVNETTMW